MDDYIKKVSENIHSTGFILENKVYGILKRNGWSVISNRYYEDDITSTPREIDLVAYKAFNIEKLVYYMTLVISCKKSNSDSWVVFTRDYNENDPNFNKYPLLYWTNDKVLDARFKSNTFNKDFSIYIDIDEDVKEIFDIKRNVFAFQQFDIKNGNKKDDKDIYNSIITTIKAANYEVKCLPKRKRSNCLYIYSMVSIFDGKLIEAICNDEEKIELKEIDNAKYLNRLIIGGNDDFYKIDFVKYNIFEQYLLKVEKCLRKTLLFIYKYRNEFYISKYKEYDYINLFLSEIKNECEWRIKYFINKNIELYGISFNKEKNSIEIELDMVDQSLLEKINNNQDIKKQFKNSLKKYYKYSGEIEFIECIPF